MPKFLAKLAIPHAFPKRGESCFEFFAWTLRSLLAALYWNTLVVNRLSFFE
jgi:hypothetical protein